MPAKMAICDMNRNKVCELYDSELQHEGQAYDVTLTAEISGWKEQSFTLPQMVNGGRNFRWNYIRSGYLICLTRDGKDDWFLLSTPKRSHKGLSVTAAITCQHICAQLNKKNLYLTFDDENGIGTAEYLLRQVLENTGWQLGYCETFYEQDGKTEKVRSLSSDGKRGAYLLIADICALFDARPVFDGDSRTISIYSQNRHEDLLELNFGKNLNGIDRKEDAENIVTRLYVEGDYGDDGYVGIEDVNPTGLPFLLDFSYFRELGVFTAEHEQALDDYLRDIQAAKAGSSDYSKELIQLDNQLNELWGQIDYVLYVLNQGAITKTICGGAVTEEQTVITATDMLIVLMQDGTHHAQTGNAFPNDAEYAIKFIKKASGRIGGKEVAIEAKESSIASLQKQLDKATDKAKRQGLQEQITALELGIQSIYQDDGGEEGLYALMRKAVQLVLQRAGIEKSYLSSMDSQQKIEKRFAEAMGDMLIDGYWSNTAYALGQEEQLYYEALGVMERLAKPTVTYTVDVQNLTGVSGYEQERFTLDTVLRIWDEALEQNDYAYITKLVENLDAPEKDSITISNDLTSIGGVSLDSIINRITGIAEIVHKSKSLYDRSKAISEDGSIPAKRLEGMIDVLKTRLSSSVSNWYTDDQGNLILESVNGKSAMQLCGEGFMIASTRTDDGKWDWRTFGTGEGFTADLIIAGFLSADRIQSGTITANKLAADVGQSLDLSSNTSIRGTISQTVDEAISEIEVGGANLIENSASYRFAAGSDDTFWVAADELKPGMAYTLSVQEVILVSGSAAGVTWAVVNQDDGVVHTSGTLEFTYGKQVRHFTVPATTGNWTLRLYDGIRGSTSGVSVQLNKVKLEEGTLATAWSPAAEDGENAITRLNDALQHLDGGMDDRVRALIDSLGLSDQYASAEEFLAALGEIELIRSELAQQDSQLTLTFNRLTQAEGSIGKMFSSFVFGDENGMPYLDMSASSSSMKMRLTNTRLAFVQSGTEVAYFSDNKLYVTRLEAVEQISIGTAANGYLDIVTTPSGVGLKWRT